MTVRVISMFAAVPGMYRVVDQTEPYAELIVAWAHIDTGDDVFMFGIGLGTLVTDNGSIISEFEALRDSKFHYTTKIPADVTDVIR